MKPQSPNCSAWLHDTWCPWQNNENEVFLGKNKGQNKCDPTQSRVFEVKRARHTDVETWPRGNRQRRGNREFSVRCDVHQPKTWRLGVRATLGSRSSGLLASAAKTNPVFRRILTSCFHMAERTRQDEEHTRAFGDYCAGLIFSNTGFDVIASIRRFIQQLLNTIKGSLVVFFLQPVMWVPLAEEQFVPLDTWLRSDLIIPHFVLFIFFSALFIVWM